MRGIALDIYVKSEMIKSRFFLKLNLKFWEHRMSFDSKLFLLLYYYCVWGHPYMTSTKMTNTWPSHFHHPEKLTIDLMFKIMKSANTWQFWRTPLPAPLLCRHHKYMFLFWFFKVWSVTCLNANQILNCMKIQSSFLLSNYQRNQASLYFQPC